MDLVTTTPAPTADVERRLRRLEWNARLSALWLVVLLNFVVRDLHEIVKAEFLADALNGVYGGREVTEAMFLLGGLIVAVPISMVALPWLVSARISRWANVVVAPLFGVSLLGIPGDLDDYFHVGLMLAALAGITWLASARHP